MAGLREALENAYEEIDTGGDSPGVEEGTKEAAPVQEGESQGSGDDGSALGADGERPRDEAGKFVKQEAKPAQSKPSTPAPAARVAGAGPAAGATPPPVAVPAKVPQSWKANVRELAAKLPPEYRPIIDEALRRDKEAAQALQARAEAEKGAGAWTDVVRPYEAQIRAAGSNPQQYVGTLLQTAHSLFYGPPHQKAPLLASLIMQAGVPPQDLDAALVAAMQGNGGQQRQQQPAEFRDPRVDQWFAQQEQQAQAEAGELASGFGESHEFFSDVGPTMADILDTWKSQGKKNVTEADLERAYEIACHMHPDVQEALKQREAAAQIATVTTATQRARTASSAVRTSPAAGGVAQPKKGLRAALEDAYDELDR